MFELFLLHVVEICLPCFFVSVKKRFFRCGKGGFCCFFLINLCDLYSRAFSIQENTVFVGGTPQIGDAFDRLGDAFDQLLQHYDRCGRSGVRVPRRSNHTQCCRRLTTATTFLRSCVVQTLSRGHGSHH